MELVRQERLLQAFPGEYGGIEFHREAITDCRWDVTKSMQVPNNLRSGVYAMRLKAGDGIGLGRRVHCFFRSTSETTSEALLSSAHRKLSSVCQREIELRRSDYTTYDGSTAYYLLISISKLTSIVILGFLLTTAMKTVPEFRSVHINDL